MCWEDFIITDDGQIAVFGVEKIATSQVSERGYILKAVENLSPEDKRIHFSGDLVRWLRLCCSCCVLLTALRLVVTN
jgi:hypothetical protein